MEVIVAIAYRLLSQSFSQGLRELALFLEMQDQVIMLNAASENPLFADLTLETFMRVQVNRLSL